jgi:hypothetical protein
MNHSDKLRLKPGMVVVNSFMSLIRVTDVTLTKTGKVKATGETLKIDGTFGVSCPFNPNKWEIL